MKFKTSSDCCSKATCNWLVVLISKSEHKSPNITALDSALGGAIVAVTGRDDFTADTLELLTLFQTSGVAADNVVLVGVGDVADCNRRTVRQAMLTGLRVCCSNKDQTVAVVAEDAIVDCVSASVFANTFGDSITSAPTDADIYKSEKARHPFSSATLCIADNDLESHIESGAEVGDCCNLVKTLVNRTAEDLTPEVFANEAVAQAVALGIQADVLEEGELVKERMGAMLAVARGSQLPPRMVRLTWKGADSGPKLAIVGKGVTFDSGGYSIKPSASMISMKADMGGAATAYGAIIAAAKLKLPVQLTVYLGLVENMISGNAYRLGDVVTARNGTTVEIHNTDAEGRLVLADVLSYAVDDGAEQLIDMATLTGACVVALGEEVTGVFAGDQTLADDLVSASESVGEYFWPMPMHNHFAPLLKSSVADCKNVGPRWGGAVTAAKFLQKFVGETPWVHLDIAGPSWADSGNSWQDAGGTADPLRSIVAWLERQSGNS